ncbi:hypothetical protein [Bacillus cereus group sp. BfR-BA-01380]|uniref:hypothetical protein n=1 Tax=Bacillus cereus group sp. BfR-BA-01380 TaxID=2920324 RepID=UPI001F569F5B|nr:hypothetical protein [Bacillus cereus group sp. BfR-BA-01380]
MKDEQVVLMMPVFKEKENDDDFYPSSGTAGLTQTLESMPVTYETLTAFTSQFTNLELDSLEVNVKGVVKTGGLTQLVVGLQGEASMKITLKKKED